MRVTCVDINESDWSESSIKTTQYIKPHAGNVKEMLCNTASENILISASEDQTVFIYNISQSANGITLLPIGFVRSNAVIESINCSDRTEDNVKIN